MCLFVASTSFLIDVYPPKLQSWCPLKGKSCCSRFEIFRDYREGGNVVQRDLTLSILSFSAYSYSFISYFHGKFKFSLQGFCGHNAHTLHSPFWRHCKGSRVISSSYNFVIQLHTKIKVKDVHALFVFMYLCNLLRIYFVCGLFHDAVSSSVASNGRTSWKGYERKRSWPNLRCCPGTYRERMKKTMKTYRIASLRAENLNPGPSEYEAGVLSGMPTTKLIKSLFLGLYRSILVHGSFRVPVQSMNGQVITKHFPVTGSESWPNRPSSRIQFTTSQLISLGFILVLCNCAGHSGRAVWGVDLGWLVAGIVGSNPAWGMDVLPASFCVVLSCVGTGLATG
jgi:hypothetical protein